MQENPSSGLSEPRVVKVFVAYDQPEAGVRAQSLCEQLEAGGEFRVEVQPWCFNTATAQEPQVVDAAVLSDILVVAWSQPGGLTEAQFEWLEGWAARRTVPDATLAAMPIGPAGAAATAAPFVHRLRHLAHTRRLVFVCDWTEGLTRHAPDFSAALNRRQQTVTPTMMSILAERRDQPHMDWGLNE